MSAYDEMVTPEEASAENPMLTPIRPLDIEWLCHKHHMEMHVCMRRNLEWGEHIEPEKPVLPSKP